MQYFSIDEELNRIYNISKITEIEIEDMSLSNTQLVFPMLSVMFLNDKNDTEYISYTSKDKYFDIFLKKVVEAYNKEKDENVLPQLSPFSKTELTIDEKVKNILSNGSLEHLNDIFKFYKDKKSYNNSLLLENSDLDFMLPIALYNLNKFLERTDSNIKFSNGISGYKYNYVLYGQKNDVSTYFPFTYIKKSDNEIVFEFGNIFNKTSGTFIEIYFKRDEIFVTIRNNEYKILTSNTYKLDDDKLTESYDTLIDGKLVSFEHNDNKEVYTLDDGTYYKLPWGALYGKTEEEQEMSEGEKIVQRKVTYLHLLDNRALKKESYSKGYRNVNYVSELNLNEYIKTTISYPLSTLENIHLIETHFHDTLHYNGYYNDNLNSKYFYHISYGKDIRDIKEEDLKSLYSEEIKTNADLDADLVLKMIGGK